MISKHSRMVAEIAVKDFTDARLVEGALNRADHFEQMAEELHDIGVEDLSRRDDALTMSAIYLLAVLEIRELTRRLMATKTH